MVALVSLADSWGQSVLSSCFYSSRATGSWSWVFFQAVKGEANSLQLLRLWLMDEAKLVSLLPWCYSWEARAVASQWPSALWSMAEVTVCFPSALQSQSSSLIKWTYLIVNWFFWGAGRNQLYTWISQHNRQLLWCILKQPIIHDQNKVQKA